MPKMKTNRSAAKRFKRTANGKYMYRKSGKSHILTKKRTKRKRHLRRPAVLSRIDRQRVQRLLGQGGRKAGPPEEERTPSAVPNDQHERIMELLRGEG